MLEKESRPRRASKWDSGPATTETVVLPAAVSTANSFTTVLPLARNNFKAPIKTECLEAAAQAAAKVNEMLIAKGKLKPSQLAAPPPNSIAVSLGGGGMGGGGIGVMSGSLTQTMCKPVQQSAALVTVEIDINDVPLACRNLLTRHVTQDEISKQTGVVITTRGRHMTVDECMRAAPSERSLHLFIQGPNQDCIDRCLAQIRGMVEQCCRGTGSQVPLIVASRVQSTPTPLLSLNTQPTSGLAFVQEKLFVGLDNVATGFSVKAKILGPGGSYLQHIQAETGAKVILRGLGSEFIEPTSGREAFEPMYIYIQHPTMVGLQQARQLAQNLIQTVHVEYAQYQQSMAALPPSIAPGTASLLAGMYQQQQMQQFQHQQQINTFGSYGNQVPAANPFSCNQNMSVSSVTTASLLPQTVGLSALPGYIPSHTVPPPPALPLIPPPLLTPNTYLPSLLPAQPPPPSITYSSSSAPCQANSSDIYDPFPDETPVPRKRGRFSDAPTSSNATPTPTNATPTPSNQNPTPNNANSTSNNHTPISVHDQSAAAVVTSLVSSSLADGRSTMEGRGAATRALVSQVTSESGRRRFKEERVEDKPVENLLGYRHGPLKLLGQPQAAAAVSAAAHQINTTAAKTSAVSQSSAVIAETTVAAESRSMTRKTKTEITSVTKGKTKKGEKEMMPPPPPPLFASPAPVVSAAAVRRATEKRRSANDVKVQGVEGGGDEEMRMKKTEKKGSVQLKGALSSVAASCGQECDISVEDKMVEDNSVEDKMVEDNTVDINDGIGVVSHIISAVDEDGKILSAMKPNWSKRLTYNQYSSKPQHYELTEQQQQEQLEQQRRQKREQIDALKQQLLDSLNKLEEKIVAVEQQGSDVGIKQQQQATDFVDSSPSQLPKQEQQRTMQQLCEQQEQLLSLHLQLEQFQQQQQLQHAVDADEIVSTPAEAACRQHPQRFTRFRPPSDSSQAFQQKSTIPFIAVDFGLTVAAILNGSVLSVDTKQTTGDNLQFEGESIISCDRQTEYKSSRFSASLVTLRNSRFTERLAHASDNEPQIAINELLSESKSNLEDNALSSPKSDNSSSLPVTLGSGRFTQRFVQNPASQPFSTNQEATCLNNINNSEFKTETDNSTSLAKRSGRFTEWLGPVSDPGTSNITSLPKAAQDLSTASGTSLDIVDKVVNYTPGLDTAVCASSCIRSSRFTKCLPASSLPIFPVGLSLSSAVPVPPPPPVCLSHPLAICLSLPPPPPPLLSLFFLPPRPPADSLPLLAPPPPVIALPLPPTLPPVTLLTEAYRSSRFTKYKLVQLINPVQHDTVHAV